MENSTVGYYVNQIGLNFNSDKEKNDFIKYCDYMMFSNYEEPHPIPEDDVKDNFRYLYKYVEMVYEEDVLEEYYAEKENDEMKYYEENDDYFDSLNYYEDLYSQYYFGLSNNNLC